MKELFVSGFSSFSALLFSVHGIRMQENILKVSETGTLVYYY